MIRVDGFQLKRVLIPELADRLIHTGENGLASRLLTASVEQRDVELEDAERSAILRVLVPGSPDGLEELRLALANMRTQAAPLR